MIGQPLYIYTEDFCLWPKIKRRLQAMLGQEIRGPRGVLRSLQEGLKELGVRYVVNQPVLASIDVACVLSGASVLKWAIKQKQAGKIKKIIAGPNIAVSPKDYGGLLKHPVLDRVIVPSQWVREFYVQVAPELASKIKIWAAGVDVPEETVGTKELDFLVFNKVGRQRLFGQIIDLLQTKNFKFKVIEYGKFYQQDYFRLLQVSKGMIYLAASESQGLALFEAWAHNVPTLIWESGSFEREGITVTGTVSCPYLSSQVGMVFKNYNDFKKVLPEFQNAKVTPRQYIIENFTHKLCAQKYLQILDV